MNPLVKSILPWALVTVVGAGGLAAYNHAQQEKGALKILLQQADSAKAADEKIRQALADSALRARRSRDSVVRLYRQGQGSIAATVAKADAAVSVLASARDSALAAAADSAATVEELRAEIRKLAAASVADSITKAAERADFLGQLARANAVILSDSVAIATIEAAHAATAKSLRDSEMQVKVLKDQRPSTFWRWAERGTSAGLILYFASTR